MLAQRTMTTTINTLMRQLKGNEASMYIDFGGLLILFYFCLVDNPVNWALIAVRTNSSAVYDS
jgi:hypothetical protein